MAGPRRMSSIQVSFLVKIATLCFHIGLIHLLTSAAETILESNRTSPANVNWSAHQPKPTAAASGASLVTHATILAYTTAPTVISSEAALTPCQYMLTATQSDDDFKVGDEGVEGFDYRYTILAENTSSGCYLTREDIGRSVKEVSKAGSLRVANIWFQCRKLGMHVAYAEMPISQDVAASSTPPLPPETENITQTEGSAQQKYYDNVISYVFVLQCTLDMKAVHAVSNSTDLRVVTFYGENSTAAFAQLQYFPALCVLFRNVVAISISDSVTSINLHYLSSCAGFLDEVVEMDIVESSLAKFPESFRVAMPNLRSLTLDGNQLTSPVFFPWKRGYTFLPRNLSRTHMFNVLYSHQNSFDIAPNVFSRVYSLNGNNITNLTCFGLRGEFHYVSLESNKMKWISSCGIFQEAQDLQFLSFADNDLQNVPENLFSNLIHLRRLDLQQNKLQNLCVKMFIDLQKLEKLNLAGNRLVVLQDGLFSGLFKLTDLILSNNTIQTISDSAILRNAAYLRLLDISNNSLIALPLAIFYLPSIVTVNLDYTDIEILDFAEIDLETNVLDLAKSVGSPNDRGFRTVTLRNSKLRSLVYYNSSIEAAGTFAYVMMIYTFLTDGSPLACDSSILNVTHMMTALVASGKLSGTEPSLQHWKCGSPLELKGRPIAELRDEETYLPLSDQAADSEICPGPCRCYRRAKVNTVIVDCNSQGLEHLPTSVPVGTTEIWLQNNSIHTLPKDVPYFRVLTDLRLSSNRLQEFPESLFILLQSLHTLYLENNLLGSLSPQLERLRKLRDVRLAGNTFRCDCQLLWIKGWLLAHQEVVRDWSEIKCNTESEDKDGQTLVEVQDDQFVCPELATLGQLSVPVAVPVGIFVVLLFLAVVGFWQRRQLKVLLYIYTGLHPFDRDLLHDGSQRASYYDVAVICSVSLIGLVMDNIVRPLEGEGLALFFYSRDARLGESVLDNVRLSIKLSLRLVVVLDKKWSKDHLLTAAVREGLFKSQKEVMNYMVLVLHQLSASDLIQDMKDPADSDSKDLSRKLIKARRCLYTQDKHFLKRLLYEMPALRHLKRIRSEGGRKTDLTVNVIFNEGVFTMTNAANKGKFFTLPSMTHAASQAKSCTLHSWPYVHRVSGSFIELSAKLPAAQLCQVVSRCPLQLQDQDQNQCEMFDEVRSNPAVLQKHPNHSDTNLPGQNLPGVLNVTQVSVPQSVFVWYGDQDLQFTLARLVQPLEQRGHRCVLQDRDFVLGAAIQDNIVQAAQTCARSVFILSRQTADNEWFLFAFHVAFERRLNRSRDHRLLLLRRHGVEDEMFAEEVRQVLETSAVLDESDPWFASRLNQFVEEELNYSLTDSSA